MLTYENLFILWNCFSRMYRGVCPQSFTIVEYQSSLTCNQYCIEEYIFFSLYINVLICLYFGFKPVVAQRHKSDCRRDKLWVWFPFVVINFCLLIFSFLRSIKAKALSKSPALSSVRHTPCLEIFGGKWAPGCLNIRFRFLLSSILYEGYVVKLIKKYIFLLFIILMVYFVYY